MYREHLDTIERRGLRFSIYLQHDDRHGAPWEEEDGHGPVREARPSYYHSHLEKRPGERVMKSRHGRDSFLYDWQEAMKIAKRDGWGLSDEHRAKLRDRLGREPTQGEITAEAVQRDFDHLRGWINDDWRYVVVLVELLDTEGDEVGEYECLGGVEDSDESYVRELADELADELAARFEGVTEITNTQRIREV